MEFAPCRQWPVSPVRGIPESPRGLPLVLFVPQDLQFKSSDVDIARIIGHLHPASLKDDWDEKRKGLDRLADRVFDYLQDQMPKTTTLNIVIVALRLLADMIQSPQEPSPTAMAPTSCPLGPPASPTSPLLRTTTCPSITWAPCGFSGLQSQLRQSPPPDDYRAPPPSPTSSAGTNTPPAPLCLVGS